MTLQETDVLQQLVRIPSVNPAFTSDGSGGEEQLTDFLQSLLEDLGWPWLRQQVDPGRENLVALCSGASSEVVLWEVHQDTVGVEGMCIDPFGGNKSDGRIWGRGACDVKGGMAAMLTALSRAQAEPTRPGPTILLALTINEECGFTGVTALCRLWSQVEQDSVSSDEVRGTLSLADLRKLRPQRAIVAEPTELDVVVAHKGVIRWRCHTHGRAAHSSQPELGSNAVYAMADVARAIDRYYREELTQSQPHPLCGHPAACVSTIQGGTGVNIVPDHAVIDIDRRLLPEEEPQQAFEDLVAYIAERTELGDSLVEHEQPWITCPGLEDSHNRPWAEQIASAARALGLSSNLIGVPYGTDASTIAANGIPAVVFGPGSIDQAHTKDEWLEIDQLTQATEVLYQMAMGQDA